jgi:hypothetical protein
MVLSLMSCVGAAFGGLAAGRGFAARGDVLGLVARLAGGFGVGFAVVALSTGLGFAAAGFVGICMPGMW